MQSLIVKPDAWGYNSVTKSPTGEKRRNPSQKRQGLSGKLSGKTQRANHYIMGRARAK